MVLRVILFIVLQLIRIDSISTHIIPLEPHKYSSIQDSETCCIVSIAEAYFPTGTILTIVDSGLDTTIQSNLNETIFDMTIEKLMLSSRWSISIKKSYSLTKLKVICSKS